MKKTIEKLKKMKTINKVILTGSFLVILVAILIISIRGTMASNDTINIPNKIVDGISFENASLEYENGISTFKVDVYNENQDVYTMNYITINFTYENGNTISLNGYIGDTLLPDTGKRLIISADEDLTDVVDLEYVITKATTENE